MILEFNKIYIENFMSLGEVELELNNKGYVSIYGVNNNPDDLAKSNGSGKSSIFEAIVWCLTGETIRGNKDVANRYFNKGTMVTLFFNVDNNEYKVTRAKDHYELKTTLKIEINGEDKSGKGIRDSEKLLKEYLPDLTHSLISSVIILGQGMPNRFTNNTPSGRKEVLEKLCKSDFMIEDLKNRVSKRKIELQEALRKAEDSILRDSTKLEGVQSQYESTEQKLNYLKTNSNFDATIQELEHLIEKLKEDVYQINSDRIALEKKIDEHNSKILSIHDRQQEEVSKVDAIYKSHIETLGNSVVELQSSLRYKLSELEKLNKIVDVCPTCGQKLPDVHKPDTTQLEEEIESIKKNLSDSKKYHSDRLYEYQTKLNDTAYKYKSEEQIVLHEIKTLKEELQNKTKLYDKLFKDINSSQLELSKVINERDNLSKNIDECKLKLSEFSVTISSLQDDLLYNNSVVENLNHRLQIVNKFNSVLTRDFRGYLLQGVIEYIDSRAKIYCKDIFDTNLIEFKLDGNNISISYNDKQYEALSGGERQKVDIIIQFSIRDMLCNYANFSTNLLALDEIFDNLDDVGCQKIIDMISSKLSDISSVFIVSHHCRELNIPYDEEIVVVKDSNGVSVVK